VDPFFNGVAIGFAIAAPVGPIGLLCIRRTLTDGTLAGLVCGLGAASADALYAAFAVFALALATALVAQTLVPLRLAGGVFLIALGVRTARASASFNVELSVPRAYAQGFLTTFALTALNPATIVSFAGIVAGAAFGAQPPAGARALRLVAGVFAGSALWWLVLSVCVGTVRRSVGPGLRRAVNLASGVTLAGFGVWTLSRVWF
jgi:threonine/homoserine/homoserine lactone efflux protein